jgi:hypothetical protein
MEWFKARLYDIEELNKIYYKKKTKHKDNNVIPEQIIKSISLDMF